MNRVIIVASAINESGGSESLFQLANVLISSHYRCEMFFVGGNEAPAKFNNNSIPTVEKIPNDKNIIVVCPEVFTFVLRDLNSVKKIIWWLSVDNYIGFLPNTRVMRIMRERNLPRILKPLVSLKVWLDKDTRWMFRSLSPSEISGEFFHLYNAEYVKRFLLKNGVNESKTYFLTPPISDEYFVPDVETSNKENIVAYNPLKGLKFLNPIIESLKESSEDIRFVPIENMTTLQVTNLLIKSKVYIDLGDFPGPDRIPRQAVLCNANILTSREGAAGNDFDLPIDKEFKFDRTDSQEIEKKLILMIQNYDKDKSKFDRFRRIIKQQRDDYPEACVGAITSADKVLGAKK
ncbi:hypothetical protein [Lacticaseibacillus pantheris]